MRLQVFLSVGVLALSGCMTSPEMAVINNAADAMGGKAAIQGANTLIVEGAGEAFTLGQNTSPDAPLPRLIVTAFKKSIDFANGKWRQERTQTAIAPGANPAPQTQITALDGTVAFNVAANGTATRASEQVSRDRHNELLHHPIGALRAALAQGAQVTNARKEGNDDAVDVVSGSDRFTLYADSTSKLPSRVVTMSYNVNLGDVAIETAFGNYGDAGGMKLPGMLTSKTDTYVLAITNVSKNTVNGDVGDLAASAETKAAAPPVLTATITVEEAGKGLWYLTGQTHHSVLIEFSDHLALIETPQNEVRAQAVIAKAKELKPDKPLTQVINTHHHFDHSGGIRAAVAAGLTIITHEGNKAFYEAVVGRKHTMAPDALAKNPKPLKIETVKDKYVLKDAMRTVELYHIAGNLHGDTLLMVYLPAERILVQADVYTPPAANATAPAAFPFAPNLMDNIQKANLRVDRLLPIHGRMMPFADFRTAVQAETKKTEN